MSGLICKMPNQKEDLQGYMSCEQRKIISSTVVLIKNKSEYNSELVLKFIDVCIQQLWRRWFQMKQRLSVGDQVRPQDFNKKS